MFLVGVESKNQQTFERERCVLLRDDFLLGRFFCREPSYDLIRSTHYSQVLTGILPSDGIDYYTICLNTIGGARPSRPTEPSQNRWLQDPVWDVITTGWRHEREQRCELPVVYHVFLTSGQREAKTGEFNNRNLMITERSRTSKRGYSNLEEYSHELPLSSSFYVIQSQKYRGA